MAISISGITSLGKVTSESIGISNNLFNKPMPSGSSDKSIATNILGKSRSIRITGNFIGTEAQQNTFIQDMEDWVNETGFNTFQANATYTDSFGNTYTVLCDSFNWSRNMGSTNILKYTITMVEGRTITTIILETFT